MAITTRLPFAGMNYYAAPTNTRQVSQDTAQRVPSSNTQQGTQLTFGGGTPRRMGRAGWITTIAAVFAVGVSSLVVIPRVTGNDDKGSSVTTIQTPDSSATSSATTTPASPTDTPERPPSSSTSTPTNGALSSKNLKPVKVYTFKDSDKDGNPDNWGVTLPWNDHFNKATKEQQYYDYNNILIKDNVLRLVATDKAQGGQPYTSAIINQEFRFSKTKPTYIEATISLDQVKGKSGMWPAFWIWPSQDGLPELDGMEMFGKGNKFQTNIVTDWNNNNINSKEYDLPSGFYKFGIEVTPKSVDGNLTGASVQYFLTPENKDERQPIGSAQNLTLEEADKLLSNRANVIVNLALGSYAGEPKKTDLKGDSAVLVKGVSINEVV